MNDEVRMSLRSLGSEFRIFLRYLSQNFEMIFVKLPGVYLDPKSSPYAPTPTIFPPYVNCKVVWGSVCPPGYFGRFDAFADKEEIEPPCPRHLGEGKQRGERR